MKNKYRHIFEPLIVGNHFIKNRIIMGSMHTGLEEGGQDDFSRMGEYFAYVQVLLIPHHCTKGWKRLVIMIRL